MANPDPLSDYLEAWTKERGGKALSPTLERAQWETALKLLMMNLKQWLNPSKARRFLDYQDMPVTISEPHLGTYTVDGLKISVGDAVVEVRPKARFLAGAHGRVDLEYGTAATATLVRKIEGNSSAWFLLTNRRPAVIPLTPESFTAALKELLG